MILEMVEWEGRMRIAKDLQLLLRTSVYSLAHHLSKQWKESGRVVGVRRTGELDRG
jgi:hypothetical protein